MALHRLTAITVGVPDVAATAAFYRDFGLEEIAPGRFATADGGEHLRLGALGIESVRTARGLETRDPAAGVAVAVSVAPRIASTAEAAPRFNGPGRHERSGRAPGLDVIPENEAWTPEPFADMRALYAWGPPPPSFLVPDDLAALMAR